MPNSRYRQQLRLPPWQDAYSQSRSQHLIRHYPERRSRLPLRLRHPPRPQQILGLRLARRRLPARQLSPRVLPLPEQPKECSAFFLLAARSTLSSFPRLPPGPAMAPPAIPNGYLKPGLAVHKKSASRLSESPSGTESASRRFLKNLFRQTDQSRRKPAPPLILRKRAPAHAPSFAHRSVLPAYPATGAPPDAPRSLQNRKRHHPLCLQTVPDTVAQIQSPGARRIANPRRAFCPITQMSPKCRPG